MKRLLIICLSAALVSLAGCSDDEDIQPAQKEKIVSFLTGTHAPRLVAEENLEEGPDLDREDYLPRLCLHLCEYRDDGFGK